MPVILPIISSLPHQATSALTPPPPPGGTLDVDGTIFVSNSQVHPDYVFEPDYELETIEEHAEFMWKNKHLPAVAPAQYDENGKRVIELGASSAEILEELEKAHIYIEQLHKQLETLEERLAKLEPEPAAGQ